MPTTRLFITSDDGATVEIDVTSWWIDDSGSWLFYTTANGENHACSTLHIQHIRAIEIDAAAVGK